MFSRLTPFLEEGEKIGDGFFTSDTPRGVSFGIYEVLKNGRPKSDRVLITVSKATDESVLVGGNPLQVDVLSGLGQLSMLDLATGVESSITLEPGVTVSIPTGNIMYSYHNQGEKELVLRDTCPEFNPDNEPSAVAVFSAIRGVIGYPDIATTIC